ncbi:MAG: hypothetical protein KGI80_00625 [Verrucomicrobiota bacterium]|nr:hypothetical protein [Verrucomicrobiota bacterium]
MNGVLNSRLVETYREQLVQTQEESAAKGRLLVEASFKCERAKEECRELKEREEALTGQVQTLNSRLGDAQSTNSALHGRVSQLQSELNVSQSELQLSAELAQQSQKMVASMQQIQEMYDQVYAIDRDWDEMLQKEKLADRAMAVYSTAMTGFVVAMGGVFLALVIGAIGAAAVMVRQHPVIVGPDRALTEISLRRIPLEVQILWHKKQIPYSLFAKKSAIERKEIYNELNLLPPYLKGEGICRNMLEVFYSQDPSRDDGVRRIQIKFQEVLATLPRYMVYPE